MTGKNDFYTFIYFSFHSNLFVLFENSKILKEHNLLSCLPYKNENVYKTTLK